MIYIVYTLNTFYTCSVTIVAAYVDEGEAQRHIADHPGTEYEEVALRS